MLFVDDSAIPKAQNEYVCWMDIMGTKGKMENSVNTCAIFILKFHSAVIAAIQKGCQVKSYPVMDGVYLTSKSVKDLKNALVHVYSELSDLFIGENNFHHKFIVKASIAYGPVIHGDAITEQVNREFAAEKAYKNSLLLGLPMIQANAGERNAPPFGVFVHESARAFCPDDEAPFAVKWWKWFLYGPNKWGKEKIKELSTAVDDYFEKCKNQTRLLDYPVDRIQEHCQTAKEYFLEV